MVTYHRHNTAASGQAVLDRLMAGESCALVTDAGMPAISDPGEEMVALCAAAGGPVVPIPGPCALVTALAASGQPTGRFTFEGFLPIKKGERAAALQAVSRLPHTLIFYEAPHRLRQTLAALLEGLGDRPITLCRELTKLHEEMQRTTLAAAVAEYAEREPRGEYVLIVAGAAVNDATAQMSLEQAAALVRRLAGEGQSLSDAAKQVAKETGYRKGDLYRLALESE